MECYLSTLFYFHQQGLLFDFLLPLTFEEKELLIENISDSSTENDSSKDLKIKNMDENIFEKVEDKKKGHQHVSSTLDLGDQNIGFFEQIDSNNDLIKKTHTVKKNNSSKKKELNTVTCAEFKLNYEEKK